jgi:hypothetical protein
LPLWLIDPDAKLLRAVGTVYEGHWAGTIATPVTYVIGATGRVKWAYTSESASDRPIPTGLDGLWRRFYDRTSKIVDIPWAIATGEDLRFPQVEGPRPLGSRLLNRYLEGVHAVASADQMICRKFFDVINLLAPPSSLMSPSVAWRVLARSAPKDEGSPRGMMRPKPPTSGSSQRRPGDFFDSIGGIIAGTPSAGTRSGGVLAAEGNRWVVTLGGTVGDYPPTNEEAWIAFAASLPVSAVHELVTSAPPLTDIVIYRFPANQRRLYERMKRFPSGYLVTGDAVCSFNPIYGQGMSVAATEAKALDDSLAIGLDGLWRRFYARTSKIVDIPWAIATGEDLRFPQVEGPRPLGSRVVNRYLDRVHAVASVDPVVSRKFFAVLNLLAPPSSLMSPRFAWRVLARSAPKHEGSPWGMMRPKPGPSDSRNA